MADSLAQIESLSRAVSGLDAKLNSVLPKMGQLINPATGNTSGSSNILSGALGRVGQGPIDMAAQIPLVGGLASSFMGAARDAAVAPLQYGMAVMPDVTSVIQRDQALYRSSIYSPMSGANYKQIGASISRTMAGGISSPGADAMGAQFMTAQGIYFSKDTNSQFQSMARNAANSAKLLGMDNMTSFQALAGLTSGAGSSNLTNSIGIYTSDAVTGKSKSEDQIFNEMWGILTGGRTDISAEDIANSFYKGNLGASLANMGLSDAQQQRFLAWAYAKAGGKRLDLSDNKSAQAAISANNAMGNANPINSTLSMNTTMTRSMQAASGEYEEGMDRAAELYAALNPTVEALIQNFGALNAQLQGFASTPTGAAAIQNPGGFLTTTTLTGNLPSAAGAVGKFAGQGIFGIIKNLFGLGGESSGNGTGVSTASSDGMGMVTPASGPITAVFGQSGKIWKSGKHRGIDYGVPEGSPVSAAAPGTVSASGYSDSLGKYLKIDHGNGIQTTYAHLSGAIAHIGDSVSAGQLIAQSGSTGNVTGPHLHFAVEKNGTAIDPRQFFSGGVAIDPSSTGNGKSKSSSYRSGSSFVGTTLDNAFSTSATGVSGALYSAADALGVAGANNWEGNSSAASLGNSSSGQTTGVGGGASGIGLGSSSGALLGAAGGTKIEINLKIDQANESEARKFAQYVKDILEQENLIGSMGRR